MNNMMTLLKIVCLIVIFSLVLESLDVSFYFFNYVINRGKSSLL